METFGRWVPLSFRVIRNKNVKSRKGSKELTLTEKQVRIIVFSEFMQKKQ